MFLKLTENYIATKFYQNCGKPTNNRSQKTYQGSCPICREGKSWLKKRRCYYIVAKNIVCCHNCGWHGSPYNWISRVTGMGYKEIKQDFENCTEEIIVNNIPSKLKKITDVPTLPLDSINLLDEKQLGFFKNNTIIQSCRSLLQTRKLLTAVNKPVAFYTTLEDKTHNNRLIIPFYNSDGKIVFYQSRSVMLDDNRPKYLSKINSEKSLYGIDNIDANIEYIFITEGPIDAMFLQNGVAVAGINESGNNNFTALQKQQLLGFPLHQKVWVLDNQHLDDTSRKKTKKLLDEGESVFIWPESLSIYKDINDYCVDKNISYFDIDTVLENTYTGLKGKLMLNKI